MGVLLFRISLLAHHWHSRLLLPISPEELGRGGEHGPFVLVMPGGGLTRERAAREPDRLVCSAHWNQTTRAGSFDKVPVAPDDS